MLDHTQETVPFHYKLVVVTYALIDVLLLWVGGYLVDLLLGNQVSLHIYAPVKALFILPTFALIGMYPGLGHTSPETLRRTFLGIVTWSGFCYVIYVVRQRDYLVEMLLAYILMGGVLFLCVYLARALARYCFQSMPWWGEPVMVVGGGHMGKLIIESLRKNPGLGYRPVAVFDDDTSVATDSMVLGIPYRGRLADLGTFALASRVETAIVAMPKVDRVTIQKMIDLNLARVPNLLLVLDSPRFPSFGMIPRDIGGLFAYQTEQRLLKFHNRLIKRTTEMFITILGTLVTLPIFFLVAVLVKLDSPGPILFGHKRIGRDGKVFKAWKFRSMHRDADKRLEELLYSDPVIRAEWESCFKLKHDPRVTRLGRFLRRTSLDEIPQVINILMGEMSLIGPRPIIDKEIERYGEAFPLVNSVLPGVTGLWQATGRSDTDYSERVQLDSYYVRNWSLWLDGYIFLKTFAVVLTKRGAY